MKSINFRTRYKIIQFFKSIDLVGFRFLSHRIPYWLIKPPREKYIANTIYGFKLIIDPVTDHGLETNIYYTGTYEAGTLNIINQLLSEGDTFVDVGANIGLMSIYASYCVKDTGQVHSFEANPLTLKILKENIKLNEINNITVHQHALGSVSTSGKIYSNLSQNRGSASLVSQSDNSEAFDIDIVPMDLIFPPENKITLIKIDIEGYELEALKGMVNILNSENPPKLIIECGESIPGVESDKYTVFNFISGLNKYNIYKIKQGKSKGSDLELVKTADNLDIHDNMICIPKTQ